MGGGGVWWHIGGLGLLSLSLVPCQPTHRPSAAVPPLQHPNTQVGGSHAASSSSQSGKRGPKRAQPLAPFCKYPNAPGTLKPWEGGLVLLDGAAGAPDPVADWQQQLAAAEAAGGWRAAAEPATAAAVGSAAAGPAVAAAAAGGGGGGGDAAALAEENAALKEQLAAALQQAQQWGRLNAQLQQLTAERLLGQQ